MYVYRVGGKAPCLAVGRDTNECNSHSSQIGAGQYTGIFFQDVSQEVRPILPVENFIPIKWPGAPVDDDYQTISLLLHLPDVPDDVPEVWNTFCNVMAGGAKNLMEIVSTVSYFYPRPLRRKGDITELGQFLIRGPLYNCNVYSTSRYTLLTLLF